ncbi:MAG: Histidinol-phosphate aminotransferase 2 [bacterium]|nr:Histidinol-phosphate aminotransferase 2 [bacterium]
MNIEKFIKPAVLDLKGYHLDKREHSIKLDQNENPFGFPETLKEKFWQRLRHLDWGRYPDFQMESLVAKIAAYVQLPEENIIVGNGSNSLIQALLLVVLSPQDRLIIPEPTFTLYGLTGKMLGAEVVTCQLQPDDFSLPLDQILQASRAPNAKLLALCTPNNPTGNSFPLAQIKILLKAFPGLVIIDEAYHEFSSQDALPLLHEHENLVILRTFSKAMSLAGMRVGYLMAAPALCAEVQKARLPYSVNLFSEIAATLALEDNSLLQKAVAEILAERERLGPALREFSFLQVYPSDANFFLVRAADGAALFQHLLNDGLLVRDVSGYPGLENCLRLSIGKPEENQKLLTSLKKWRN